MLYACKAFAKALRDANENPITTRREADEARQKFMAPFVVADEAAALESIAGKVVVGAGFEPAKA
jgi:hypothetical protein